MDRVESAKILAVIKGAYPMSYQGVDVDSIIALWQEMFADEDYSLVAMAVKAFIAVDTKGFPPSIGMVKDYILKLKKPQEMTEMEAWGLIRKAIGNSGYNAQEEFNSLPETLRQIIGSPNVLREWAMVDLSEVETVIQSNFMRSYKVKVQRVKEWAALPDEVKKVSAALAEKFSMDKKMIK